MRKQIFIFLIISFTLLWVNLECAYGEYVFVAKWGSLGTGDGQFYGPWRVALDADGYVYVTDASNHYIQKFDSVGTFITKWGSYGTGDGQFHYASGIAIDADGYVYVADDYNHRIQKFDSVGNFITKWGSYGTGDGQFIQPRGIAVDADGYVYVPDWGNHRIQKFREVPVPVIIDIKPGSYPNSINLDSKGVVPVAVLTTDEFDASTVDPSTVEFAEALPVRWATEDVDFDGDMDLLFHFKTQELNLIESDTEATLIGTTFDGEPIEGTDTVNIVPQE